MNLTTFVRLLAVFGLVCGAASSRAAINFSMEIWNGYNGSFYYPAVYLNNPTPAPVTYHRVESASGVLWRNVGTNNSGNNFFLTNDLAVVVNECTNGLWKLWLNKGDASEELYFFTVGISGVTPGVLGGVQVFYPANNSVNVPANATFHFAGPVNLPLLSVQAYDDYGYSQFANLPSTATNWTPGVAMPGGAQVDLYINYRSNNHVGFTFSTPTNSSGTPLAGWNPRGDLGSYVFSMFTVASGGGGGGGHALTAHYTFNGGSIFAADESGNGNGIGSAGSFGGGSSSATVDALEGGYALLTSNNGGTGGGWVTTPTAVLDSLAGSFSVSAWVKTSESPGSDGDAAYLGQGIIAAFNGGSGDTVIPMALTGGKLAFFTGGSPQATLHSAADINTGNYVHIVVTRNQATGEKKIYVDGVLDATGSGSTALLDGPEQLNIGWNNNKGFGGQVDDVQFYTGVLSASEVDFLYNHPGETVPDTGVDPLAEAVDAPSLAWTTGGSENWFPQTATTYDGMDAAQSGGIGDDQESWIETTIIGPGTLEFWWRVSSDDFVGYDYLELSVNGGWVDEIAGESGWQFFSYGLDEGTNVVRWTYRKDEIYADGADAAWLDEVMFIPTAEIEMELSIERNQSGTNTYYYVFPSINYANPAPLTEHEVESPNGLFSGSTSGSGTVSQTSLAAVINEIQAGPWRLYLNRSNVAERLLTFTVNVPGLTTNVLPGSTLFHPLDGATNVATNAVFHWQGPTNYSSLFVNVYHRDNLGGGGFAGLSVTDTNWTPFAGLVAGTNTFYYAYQSNNFPGVSFSDPLDAQNAGLSSWGATAQLVTSGGSTFVVSAAAPPPAPATLLNPARAGGDFTFSLMSQAGRTHTVESRTNLVLGSWVVVTNFAGDGTLKLVTLPLGTNGQAYFRVGTQ